MNAILNPFASYRYIPGATGYLVSDDGTVWSQWSRRGLKGNSGPGTEMYLDNVCRPLKKVTMKPNKARRGNPIPYQYANVKIDGVRTLAFIHKLVLLSFKGPCPDGMEIRHLNGNATDNRLDNLIYGTKRENTEDRFRHGTVLAGARHPRAKLTENDILSIRERALNGESASGIARELGITKGHAARIIRGKAWKDVA